ncbi:DUF429 domain-containing protein [Salinirubellus salinus]|uniref:DUF429 domain-containing protein n=1 Tax=Salinirubellus salinus TaxID=1364945 RepID=A0A9E7R3D4_9EURY|nr:DUF429 domain-containing protein [Salinirubellus salinus]UWM54882.1 DUF429 domain-containing protein [Salinirubellus salinus]
MQVTGVDFSGSAEPGEDVWLTTGEWDGQRLRVTDARPASEAFDASGRRAVLAGLRAFVREGDVTGLDFSFGLPRPVLPESVDSWAASLGWVREREYADALAAQADWKDRARASDADGVELKRATDRPVGASSPYSFITRYQTFHGMRDVLGPLVRDGAVSVQPMVDRDADATLCEIYPAGTLRDLGLPDTKYKDDANYPDGPERRERILDGLVACGVEVPDPIRERLLGDPEGDALDSLVATVATAWAVDSGFAVEEDRYDPVEGYIYV